MDSFVRDARYALRSLRRSPSFTAIATLTLALGIGATTALFSVVHGVLLRPLPYPAPERIVQLWQINGDAGRAGFSFANLEDVRAQSRSFAAVAEMGLAAPVTVIVGGEPVRVSLVAVSRDFLAVMGVEPALGRGFVADEQRESGTPAVLVSHRFWQQEMGAPGDLADRTITSGNLVAHVVGVLPPSFDFPAGIDLFTPRELTRPAASRTAHNYRAIARLREGVTVDAARRELSAIARRLRTEHGERTWMTDATAVTLHEQIVGSVRTPLLVLLGAAAFLLLIACANVTNLFLARTAARQRELAVRVAMGAGKGQLVKQFMMESFVVALAAGVLGVTVAMLGVRALLALEPGNLPRTSEIGVNWSVLAFAFVVSLLTALALGVLAALRGVGPNLHGALAQSQRSLAGGGARVRSALTVAQVALTLVLLVGAGLLGRSFIRLLTVDPGFRTDRAVVLDLVLPHPEDESMGARQTRIHEELMARIRAIPGVTSVGGVNSFPLRGGGANGAFVILTRPDEPLDMARIGEILKDEARAGYAEFRVTSDGYFGAMGIPLVRGRLFDERDTPNAPHVAVISESLAEKEFAGQDPIGRSIQFGNMDGVLTPYVVVGIVGDVRDRSLDGLPQPTFYGNARQRWRVASRFSLVIASADPDRVIAPTRAALREIAPDVPPRFRLLEEVVAASVATRRFSLVLFAVFGGAALVLAMLGVYSVISYLVAQREHEIGIRVALGAQRSSVVALVLRHATILVGIGITVGVAAAAALTRLIAGLLYGVTPTDPIAFAGVVGVIVAVAFAASAAPAMRATRVDPMTVLRNG